MCIRGKEPNPAHLIYFESKVYGRNIGRKDKRKAMNHSWLFREDGKKESGG
jgi:hypothetical protein